MERRIGTRNGTIREWEVTEGENRIYLLICTPISEVGNQKDREILSRFCSIVVNDSHRSAQSSRSWLLSVR